jgi:hypothetical protein
MKTALMLACCTWLLSTSGFAGTRVLTFIYQPLTNLGTDQDPGITIAKIPVLTNTVPEGLLSHIATPNRLVQDESAKVSDSNLLSSLGVEISAELRDEAHYAITLDLTKLGDLERFDITTAQVVEAVIECITKTVNETYLFHAKDQLVTWNLSIRSRPSEGSALKRYERRYKAARPR